MSDTMPLPREREALALVVRGARQHVQASRAVVEEVRTFGATLRGVHQGIQRLLQDSANDDDDRERQFVAMRDEMRAGRKGIEQASKLIRATLERIEAVTARIEAVEKRILALEGKHGSS